jgi:hypothetical protein
VYAGVREAVFKQNGITGQRHLMHRLNDRKIGLFGLVEDCPCGIPGRRLSRELEALLLDRLYAGFIEAALAISDDEQRGLINDLGPFERWCGQMAAAVAGQAVAVRHDFTYTRSLPPVLKLAFDALLSGISDREKPQGTPR